MEEKPKRAGTTRRPYQRMFAIHRAISKGGYPNCSTLARELEVTAIVKGTKNLEAAKKLADWAASKKANELYAKTYPIVAFPGVASAGFLSLSWSARTFLI